jgi:hypothetical protein
VKTNFLTEKSDKKRPAGNLGQSVLS